MLKRSFHPDKPEELTSDREDEQVQARLFAEAMSDVRRLQFKKTIRRRNGLNRAKIQQQRSIGDISLLTDFVEGKTHFEWSYHPGYSEGGPEGQNAPLMKKLRQGGFSVQAQLDLHGYTKDEALEKLESFLKYCGARQFRCVRIIHGKGRNSSNRVGVLKKWVPVWLSMKRFARLIVAFSSAPQNDGGLGATYILLRKHATPRCDQRQR